MTPSRHRWLALICLALPVACGDDDSKGGDAAPVAEADFFTGFTEITCEGQAQCCTRGSRGFDQTKCQEEAGELRDELQGDSSKDGLAYDPQVGGNCLAQFRQQYASCRQDEEQLDEQCEGIYHGTRGLGEACTRDECGRTSDGTLLRCARTSVASQEGTCQAVSRKVAREGKHGQAGDACTTSCSLFPGGGISCTSGGSSQSPIPDPNAPPCFDTDGLYCGPDNRCVPPVAEGQPCSAQAQCAPGLSCTFSQVCEAQPGVGTPCAMANICGDSTYCNVAADRCEERKTTGQPCEEDDECASFACSGGACREPDDLTQSNDCKP